MSRAIRGRPDDQATVYAKSVLQGETVAGPLVVAACQRHISDLERDDLIWDLEAAERIIAFYREVLRLSKGDFEGVPFILDPWQAFIAGSLFGWKVRRSVAGQNDLILRRFATGYVEAGKGAGKGPFAGGIGLYMAFADEEPRAEVYSAAVDKNQASLLFRDAVAMWQQSPILQEIIHASGGEGKEWNLYDPETKSFFRPISSDTQAKGKSGPVPHCVLLDELHEHPSSAMVDFMSAGTKLRRQPMILEITNSGWDRNSVCWQHHEYSRKVVTGIIKDDSWFAYVCGLAEGDDWRDEKVWPKANPHIGCGALRTDLTLAYLRRQVAAASGMPAKENVVKRLNFCIWTAAADIWIQPELWLSCVGEAKLIDLRDRPCFVGLDVAATTDLAAGAVLFPPFGDDPKWRLVTKFWCPEEGLDERSIRDRAPYRLWVEQGYMDATKGPTIDQRAIREWLNDLRDTHDIVQVGYDPWAMTQLATELEEDGFTMVKTFQTFAVLSAPSKQLVDLLKTGEIVHNDHPVMNMCVGNAAARASHDGLHIKPDKARSSGRIDGLAASINALARAAVTPLPGQEWDGKITVLS